MYLLLTKVIIRCMEGVPCVWVLPDIPLGDLVESFHFRSLPPEKKGEGGRLQNYMREGGISEPQGR